jgi:heme/copper-type cytochrome/quinol oxidase subunit 3
VGGIQRPNSVQVGTIVWLGSEVMFFAGLFAIYFTLKSTSPGLWADQSSKLNIVFSKDRGSLTFRDDWKARPPACL